VQEKNVIKSKLRLPRKRNIGIAAKAAKKLTDIIIAVD